MGQYSGAVRLSVKQVLAVTATTRNVVGSTPHARHAVTRDPGAARSLQPT
jgi:hypothetical protein